MARPKTTARSLRGFIARREAAQQTDSPVLEFRAVLRTAAPLGDLPATARKLGVSVRTLQHRLAKIETTFQNEDRCARLEAAQSMMLVGGVNLTRIALDLCFASFQSFSALFRKHYGESPRAWLKQHSRTETHVLSTALSLLIRSN